MTVRVLHILDHSVPLQSGYSFRTLSIIKQQRELGWETFQLTGPKQGPAIDEEVDGIRFQRTEPPPSARSDEITGVREMRQMQATARRLESIARQIRPQILHAHSPVLDALPAMRVGRRLGIPVVYEIRAFWEDAAVDHGTSRGGGLRYRLTRGLETWAARRVSAVTTICDGLRADLIARGIPGANVTVIPNAVDIEAFVDGQPPDASLQRALRLEGTRVLGFIGSFYAYEGIDVLLRGLQRLLPRMPKLRVLLVGGGPQEARLKQLAADLGIADKAVFTGRVPHDDVQRYYDLIDILVYPRLSMRLTELVTPLKPLEAMAQGRLVAASDVGGHRELIRDGATGVLFAPNDPDALASTIADLLESPERWPQMRATAREFVKNERTWPQSVVRYAEVYASAMRRSLAA